MRPRIGSVGWVALGLLAGAGPALGAPPGRFTADYSIQNLGSRPAIVMIRFVNPDGSEAGKKTFYNVPAGGSAYFHPARHALDGGIPLPAGWWGTAIVSADQPVAAVTTVANDLSGPLYASDAYGGAVEPSPILFAPLVRIQRGSWNTRIVVQNAGDAPANVRIRFVSGRTVVAAQTISDLPAGASAIVDRYEHPALSHFNGSAVITGTAPLVVTVDEYRTRGGLLISYTGLPLSKAGTTLYMPGYLNAYGPWTTDFTLVNTSNIPAFVRIRFTNNQILYCTVPANGNLYLNPAAGVYGGCAGGPLASNFHGAATVSASQPIVIAYRITNALGPGDQALAYTAVHPADTGTKMAVPLIQNQYGEGKWTTAFAVQVIGGGTARLSLTYKGNLGTFTWRGLITDFRAFNPASDGHVPAGFLGSALILSDKPLAVVGSRSSPIQPGDAAAGFPGVKVP
jgi:hypothetical protein